MNDLKLIKNCIRKDPTAQKKLFESHYMQMYNLVMRFLANHHDSEDVLIIAFSKVFDNIEHFEYRGDNSLKKWIKTIAINESIRFLEHKKPLHLLDDPVTMEKELTVDEENASLDIEEAYAIIEQMPVGYRTVFNLYAIEGFSHQEISEMLNIALSTSKSQLCKARNYIIEKLKKLPTYGTQQIG